jgi:hypothetical protein
MMENRTDASERRQRSIRLLGFAYFLGSLAGLAMIGVLIYSNAGHELEVAHYAIFAFAAVAFAVSLLLQIRATRQLKKERNR